MSHITIPEGYQSLLGLYDTQKAIGLIKTIFQEKLCMALHLKRVTAPLFVMQGSGLNDDLNGVERPVSFDVPSLNEQAEVVHSLAKWKRYALYKYGFRPGQGIVTDMNAVRRDEELDNLHSIYVDQWDWERVITADQRTLEFLQETVRDIVDAVCATSDELRWKFPELKTTSTWAARWHLSRRRNSRTGTRTSRRSSARMPLPKSMEPSASCRSAAGSRAASPTTDARPTMMIGR